MDNEKGSWLKDTEDPFGVIGEVKILHWGIGSLKGQKPSIRNTESVSLILRSEVNELSHCSIGTCVMQKRVEICLRAKMGSEHGLVAKIQKVGFPLDSKKLSSKRKWETDNNEEGKTLQLI